MVAPTHEYPPIKGSKRGAKLRTRQNCCSVAPSPPPQRDQFPGTDDPVHATRLVVTQQADKALDFKTSSNDHFAAAKAFKHSMTNRANWSMSLCYINWCMEWCAQNSCRCFSHKCVNAETTILVFPLCRMQDDNANLFRLTDCAKTSFSTART